MKSRVTYRDRVPIKPIPRADSVFDHFFVDCAGPLFSTEGSKPKFNYAFVAVDSFSRFPFCVPLIGKLAVEHPRDWHNVLPMVMWCLREVENETTGVAPWTLVMGHLPRGPLTILKES